MLDVTFLDMLCDHKIAAIAWMHDKHCRSGITTIAWKHDKCRVPASVYCLGP